MTRRAVARSGEGTATVEEPTTDRPDGPARPTLARALTASIRRPGDKGTVVGRVVTAGLAVLLTCAVAIGVGAVVAHGKGHAKTTDAAAQRSLSASPLSTVRSPTLSPSTARVPKKYVVVTVGPGGVPVQGKTTTITGTQKPAGHSGRKKVSMVSVAEQTIVGDASGRCINVTNYGQSGVPLQIWDCGPVVDWKRWAFYPDETIRSMGECMTLVGGSADGSPIELEPCNGGASQRFVLNTSSDLVNVAADKCVDVKDKQTANGTPLQLWQCAGTSNQKWHTSG